MNSGVTVRFCPENNLNFMSKISRPLALLRWGMLLFFANLADVKRAAAMRQKVSDGIGKTLGIRISIGGFYLRKGIRFEKIAVFIGRFDISIGTIQLIGIRQLLIAKTLNLSISDVQVILVPLAGNKKEEGSDDIKVNFSLAWIYSRLIAHLERLFKIFPHQIEINRLTLQRNGSSIFHLQHLGFENCKYSSTLEFKGHQVDVTGALDPKTNHFSIEQIHSSALAIPQTTLPLLNLTLSHPFGLALAVNVPTAIIAAGLVASDQFTLKDMYIDIDCSLSANDNLLEISSNAGANGLTGSLIICEGSSIKGLIEARLLLDEFSFTDLAHAFPFLMKEKLQAIHTSGMFQEFDASFVFDPKRPSLQSLEAHLPHHVSFLGTSPFAYLAQPFLHQPISGQHPIPQLNIGIQSDDFVPLAQIPDYVLKIIVRNEDPHFWKHEGVDVPLFGNAMVHNLLEKKLARGGSTIPMQLARNLYLGHQKSVSRKLEEILIALLLVQTPALTKERLLEIYLNIIEFGHNIYGLKSACSFYFGITPQALTLQQTLILTYIIPRPKHFLEAFMDESLQLKTNLHWHLKRYGGLLLAERTINGEELAEMTHHVEIRGKRLEFRPSAP